MTKPGIVRRRRQVKMVSKRFGILTGVSQWAGVDDGQAQIFRFAKCQHVDFADLSGWR